MVLLNAASLLHVSEQVGLDVSGLESAGFERAAADARYLSERVDSPGGGLVVLAVLFVVEVLSPVTQRWFQRFMVAKIDRALARENAIGGVDDELSASRPDAG